MYDNTETTVWPADRTRRDWDLITERVRAYRPTGGSVLDFGCYTGGLLARLGPSYQRFGVEINHAAMAIAGNATGASIWRSLCDIPETLRFDVVIAADVLEHLPNPRLLIDSLMSRLAEGGILILSTGDADNFLWRRFGANWWYCFYPEHIAFISKAWLEHAGYGSPLTLVHLETFYYVRLSKTRRFAETLLTYFYGFFPSAYLGLKNLAMKMLGRPGMATAPGVGVSADHLFIVLTRKVEA